MIWYNNPMNSKTPAIPSILSDICEYLAADGIVLNHSAEDGRIASANNEKQIIQKIADNFDLQQPDKSRCWWDFAVTDKGIFYPVNLKISEFQNANDNLNCKLGIYYALTGQDPNFANEIGWSDFFRLLANNMQKNDKDYYFLVVNKLNTNDVLVQGLKTISTLVPNGNNLPFQCCWLKNRQPVVRPFTEAQDFLLSHLARSVKLRTKIYFDFRQYFPTYSE